MTPAMKAIVCDLAEQRLSQLMREENELRQVIRELQNEPPATNGVDVKTVPLHRQAESVASADPRLHSPLETRLEQLREQHGPVFIIDPKNPVAAGQRIKWGKPEKPSTVEVLESAELPGKDGSVVPARYFAKLVDV